MNKKAGERKTCKRKKKNVKKRGGGIKVKVVNLLQIYKLKLSK